MPGGVEGVGQLAGRPYPDASAVGGDVVLM